MIGCYKARTVPINLNFRYVAPELRYVVDNADLGALVYERAAVRSWWPTSLDGGGARPARDLWCSRTAPRPRRRTR